MMNKFLAVLAAVVGFSGAALAQSPPSPALYYGFIPTPAQWNGYFEQKQDTIAYTPVNRAGDTMAGKLVTLTPSTSGAGLNLPPGVAPTSPVNGDIWTTSAGVFARINGATVGPFGGGGGISALTGDVTASGSGSVAATLATVNANVGSFGDATHSPSFTVNGKGLITAASTNTIAPPFSAVTGSLACSQTPALTGDATTSAGSCALLVVKLQGRSVISTAPSDGQVLTWVAANSDWEPNSAPSGNVPVGGTTGQALVKIDATNFNTQWATVSGLGTVTSVGLTGVSGILNVSGSPVTTTGTLALSLATQSANALFAGPTTGSASAPTFRALVGADLPNPSASSLGGVQSITPLSHNWVDSINTSGVPHQSQPAFTDLSGSLASGQLPGLASGNLWVGNGGGAATAVAISGDATMSNTGALTVTKTSGSAFGTAATQNTGTSGATLPFLNGANTWSAAQTHTASINVNFNLATPFGLVYLSSTNGTSTGVTVDSYGTANAQFSILTLRSATGTGASPGQTAANQILGLVGAEGWTSSGAWTTPGAQVRFIATEAQTVSAQGKSVAVVTTPNGTTSSAIAATFNSSGGLSIGIGGDPGLGGLSVGGPSFFGGSIVAPFRTVTASGAVTINVLTDYFVCINKTVGAATTVNLTTSGTGETYLIKDCKGDAATNHITLTPASGTIDGASTFVMSTNFQSAAVTFDGTNWFVN